MSVLIQMHGYPGSGKSAFARTLGAALPAVTFCLTVQLATAKRHASSRDLSGDTAPQWGAATGRTRAMMETACVASRRPALTPGKGFCSPDSCLAGEGSVRVGSAVVR